MQYCQIPGTDLNVSVITLGTWVLGGDSWGGAKDAESLAAIQSALDCGINLIDTAPIYGFGVSEEIVGRALEGKRDRVLIATKCGLMWNGKRIRVTLDPESIKKEVDDSLRRLRTDYIDVYQCHWPDPATPVEKTFAALLKLKEQKKIRYIGVSNFEADLLKQAVAAAPIVTVQNQYSILERTIENEVLPWCRGKGIGVLAYGPLVGGILTGKYKTPATFSPDDARSFFYKYYSGPAFNEVTTFIDELKKIGKPLNQIAVNWVRQQPGVSSVIVGSRTTEHVRQNAQAADWDLTPKQMEQIQHHKIQR